jgi:hypothetical protein
MAAIVAPGCGKNWGQVLPFASNPQKLPLVIELSRQYAEVLKMARPLRIEFPGAIYHLASRGNRRERSVLDDDREDLLSVLGRRCIGLTPVSSVGWPRIFGLGLWRIR